VEGQSVWLQQAWMWTCWWREAWAVAQRAAPQSDAPQSDAPQSDAPQSDAQVQPVSFALLEWRPLLHLSTSPWPMRWWRRGASSM